MRRKTESAPPDTATPNFRALLSPSAATMRVNTPLSSYEQEARYQAYLHALFLFCCIRLFFVPMDNIRRSEAAVSQLVMKRLRSERRDQAHRRLRRTKIIQESGIKIAELQEVDRGRAVGPEGAALGRSRQPEEWRRSLLSPAIVVNIRVFRSGIGVSAGPDPTPTPTDWPVHTPARHRRTQPAGIGRDHGWFRNNQTFAAH